MSTKTKRPRGASITPTDKIEAVQRVNDGESKASVARDIGVPESTLRGWCKSADKLRYQASYLSSPDTDKSNDAEPPDKRSCTVSPIAPLSPATAGLDLSNTSNVAHSVPAPAVPTAPIELTKRRETSPPIRQQRERGPDPYTGATMSASSPLSRPGSSHLGLSYTDIATNLTLLAQINPGLSALSAQSASRALRSVRSPKPAHNGHRYLNETKNRNKPYHSTGINRHTSNPNNHIPPSLQPVAPLHMDDALLYWIKTHQALMGLQSTTGHPLTLGNPAESALPSRPVAPAPQLSSAKDYNRYPWVLQYYKELGGAITLPDDKVRSISQIYKENVNNILYSHLTKEKPEDRETISPLQAQASERHSEERRAAQPAKSPEVGTENKGLVAKKPSESGKSQTRARNVLDNLLFNNHNPIAAEESKNNVLTKGDWESGTIEALEHGDKFLAWLEASSDPTVTRLQVHTLRAMLHNLRARRGALDASQSK